MCIRDRLRKGTEKRRAHAEELRREIDAAAHPFHAGVDDAGPMGAPGAHKAPSAHEPRKEGL